MKRIILGLLILSIAEYSFGQIRRGALLIEGTIGFNVSNTEDQFSVNSSFVTDELKTTFLFIRPRIGFVRSETFLIGIGLNYEFNKQVSQYSIDGNALSINSEKSSVYLVNPYIRKYLKINEKIFFTISGNGYFGAGKRKYSRDSDAKSDLLNLRLNIEPGITYFISNQCAFSVTFGQVYFDYKKEKLKTDIGLNDQPENIDTNYGASFLFNTFGIGVQYFIRNKE